MRKRELGNTGMKSLNCASVLPMGIISAASPEEGGLSQRRWSGVSISGYIVVPDISSHKAALDSLG